MKRKFDLMECVKLNESNIPPIVPPDAKNAALCHRGPITAIISARGREVLWSNGIFTTGDCNVLLPATLGDA